jgi:general secretion pathway protein G
MIALRDRFLRATPQRDGEGGFTLVELLVVLVILSLIMGLVGPRVLNYLTDARVRSTKLQIDSLSAALDLFYLDNGRYPSQSEGLQALITRSTSAEHWNGPYLQQSAVPLDPWGHAYDYHVPGDKKPYAIVSLGSDGRQGGTGDAADITNK